MPCRRHVAQLRDHEKIFIDRNVRVVVITFEDLHAVRRYVADTSLSWPLLIDEHREIYRTYGMYEASFGDVWGPRTWWVYVREMLRGQSLKKSAGDAFQRGGDVLVDPTGMVRLHYVGRGPADRPSVDLILKRIDTQQHDQVMTTPGTGVQRPSCD